ncbi:MAG: DUF971 domain-containing protein [Planctomycetota bacterium]
MNVPEAPTLTSLQRTESDDGIVIGWADHTTTHWTSAELRAACPCAICKEKHGSGDADAASTAAAAPAAPTMLGLPVLSNVAAGPIRITGMRPVGTYGYNIVFSDNHKSGIYTLNLLHAGPQPGN